MNHRSIALCFSLAVCLTLSNGVLMAQPARRFGPSPLISRPLHPGDKSVEALLKQWNESHELVALSDWAQALADSATGATTLFLSVSSRGAASIGAAPGERVDYEVVGVLTDDANQGLALVGFDLVFNGGDLPQADSAAGEPTPGCDNPMINFTRPWGIANPAGFGGTMINGELIQVGGAQNTINNTPDHAPYPIGPVLLGVAHPFGCGPIVAVTGSLSAPEAEGVYTLAIRNMFANVIKADATGDPFWAVEAAATEGLQDLTVHVSARFGSRARPPFMKRQRVPRSRP